MAWTGSDFEVRELGIKFKGSDEYKTIKCLGSLEEEMVAKTVTKKCRGVVKKRRTKGTGEGTIKISAHIPWDVYTEFFGMDLDTLVEGVKAYGQNSIHKEFAMTADVFDEDENEKLKAYPVCMITANNTRKIENGAEEVAEVEIEIGTSPDDFGNGLYEAVVEDLKDETVKTTWMTAFDPAMVQIESA